MVHGVAALIERHLLVVDAIGLAGRRDRGRIAGQPDEVRIEARQVVLHDRRRIALGIDGDEEGAGAISIGAERPHDLGHLEQGRRADVRAMGEPEEHQEWTALEVLIRHLLAVLVGELERTADGGDLLGARRREAPGHEHHDTEADHQPGEECRAHHQDPDAACAHARLLSQYGIDGSRRATLIGPPNGQRQAEIPATIVS